MTVFKADLGYEGKLYDRLYREDMVAAYFEEVAEKDKVKRMSRPPIKAFEEVRDYCKNNRSCEGCPLHHGAEGAFCVTYPELWRMKKEGEVNGKL